METQNEYTAYRLANMIDARLESNTSEGARWLECIASNWISEGRDLVTEYGMELGDAIHQEADGIVPIYTGHRWEVFTDLQGWQFSDEIAQEYGTRPDMTDMVGVILYALAERLIYALEAARDENEGEA